jgi:hypothetical protein
MGTSKERYTKEIQLMVDRDERRQFMGRGNRATP